MSKTPKLCAAGATLRKEIDVLWPWRDKKSDGWLGDSAHQARKSDHNPDPETGIVRAIDLDEDLRGTKLPNPQAANHLVKQLVAMAKGGDDRIAYVIFEGKIYSSKKNWAARPYTGLNAHNTHVHISFTLAGDTDGKKFGVVKP